MDPQQEQQQDGHALALARARAIASASASASGRPRNQPQPFALPQEQQSYTSSPNRPTSSHPYAYPHQQQQYRQQQVQHDVDTIDPAALARNGNVGLGVGVGIGGVGGSSSREGVGAGSSSTPFPPALYHRETPGAAVPHGGGGGDPSNIFSFDDLLNDDAGDPRAEPDAGSSAAAGEDELALAGFSQSTTGSGFSDHPTWSSSAFGMYAEHEHALSQSDQGHHQQLSQSLTESSAHSTAHTDFSLDAVDETSGPGTLSQADLDFILGSINSASGQQDEDEVAGPSTSRPPNFSLPFDWRGSDSDMTQQQAQSSAWLHQARNSLRGSMHAGGSGSSAHRARPISFAGMPSEAALSRFAAAPTAAAGGASAGGSIRSQGSSDGHSHGHVPVGHLTVGSARQAPSDHWASFRQRSYSSLTISSDQDMDLDLERDLDIIGSPGALSSEVDSLSPTQHGQQLPPDAESVQAFLHHQLSRQHLDNLPEEAVESMAFDPSSSMPVTAATSPASFAYVAEPEALRQQAAMLSRLSISQQQQQQQLQEQLRIPTGRLSRRSSAGSSHSIPAVEAGSGSVGAGSSAGMAGPSTGTTGAGPHRRPIRRAHTGGSISSAVGLLGIHHHYRSSGGPGSSAGGGANVSGSPSSLGASSMMAPSSSAGSSGSASRAMGLSAPSAALAARRRSPVQGLFPPSSPSGSLQQQQRQPASPANRGAPSDEGGKPALVGHASEPFFDRLTGTWYHVVPTNTAAPAGSGPMVRVGSTETSSTVGSSSLPNMSTMDSGFLTVDDRLSANQTATSYETSFDQSFSLSSASVAANASTSAPEGKGKQRAAAPPMQVSEEAQPLSAIEPRTMAALQRKLQARQQPPPLPQGSQLRSPRSLVYSHQQEQAQSQMAEEEDTEMIYQPEESARATTWPRARPASMIVKPTAADFEMLSAQGGILAPVRNRPPNVSEFGSYDPSAVGPSQQPQRMQPPQARQRPQQGQHQRSISVMSDRREGSDDMDARSDVYAASTTGVSPGIPTSRSFAGSSSRSARARAGTVSGGLSHRRSADRYDEVRAALQTLRTYISQTGGAGVSSSYASSSAGGASSPYAGRSVDRQSPSAARSGSTYSDASAGRTLRHPRGPLPPRGQGFTSSSSSSSVTMSGDAGGRSRSSTSDSLAPQQLTKEQAAHEERMRVLQDVSDRIRDLKQRSQDYLRRQGSE